MRQLNVTSCLSIANNVAICEVYILMKSTMIVKKKQEIPK